MLLKTYTEAINLIEDVHSLLNTLSEFSASSMCQRELIDISVVQEVWTRCAKLIVNIPYVDNLWDKIKEIADFETEIRENGSSNTTRALELKSNVGPQEIKDEFKKLFKLMQKTY